MNIPTCTLAELMEELDKLADRILQRRISHKAHSRLSDQNQIEIDALADRLDHQEPSDQD